MRRIGHNSGIIRHYSDVRPNWSDTAPPRPATEASSAHGLRSLYPERAVPVHSCAGTEHAMADPDTEAKPADQDALVADMDRTRAELARPIAPISDRLSQKNK